MTATNPVPPEPGVDGMDLCFTGEVWYWRGPAPFYFVTVPAEPSADLHEASALLSYGWGCIRVRARIGGTEWHTALIPKDGRYLVPVKAMVRTAEGLAEGDIAQVRLWPRRSR
jgi:hypothetical protein